MKQTLEFNGQDIYVGFDVHKKDWKVTIMSDKLVHKTFSQPPKPEVLVQYLTKNFPGAHYHTAYEAGFCGFWIHHQLKQRGINSIIVNPADIPTTQKEKVQKEDQRDSRKIARQLAKGELTAIHVPEIYSIENRALIRTRTDFVGDVTRYKSRIKSFLMFHGIDIPKEFEKNNWSKKFLGWLKEVKLTQTAGNQSLNALIITYITLRDQVATSTREIRQLSKSEFYAKNMELMFSIPGFGLINSMTVLTEVEQISRFKNNDHFASFIGLTPGTHSSGDNDIDTGITVRGHGSLRKAFIEAAWVAVAKDPALMHSFHKYCKRMEKNKAIIRIAKKLACRVQYVLRTGMPYINLKQ
jgi:Transposase and inactivated derivatives